MLTIQEILRESVSGGFWKFAGYWTMIALMITVPARLIAVLFQMMFKHFTIRKHGYPPPHCDAEGDFKTVTNE